MGTAIRRSEINGDHPVPHLTVQLTSGIESIHYTSIVHNEVEVLELLLGFGEQFIDGRVLGDVCLDYQCPPGIC